MSLVFADDGHYVEPIDTGLPVAGSREPEVAKPVRPIDTPCSECRKRAAAGPHFDPLRGTGRTTHKVSRALLAAALGHRVLFVAKMAKQAQEMCVQAAHMLRQDHAIVMENVTTDRLTLTTGGWIDFKSMSAPLDYRGVAQGNKPTLELWDHAADAERTRRIEQEIREQDIRQIKTLMKKHGLHTFAL